MAQPNLSIQNRLKVSASAIIASVKNVFVPQQIMQTGGVYSGQYMPHFIPPNPKNISSYIAPVQFVRQRPDIQTWRDAISEAENAWYPHRVKMQRLYIDTILNGHVAACMEARQNLTLLRQLKLYRNGTELEEKDTKEIIGSNWFSQFVKNTLDAQAFGYSLIQIGDIVNGKVNSVSEVRRWNISPDRFNVTSLVYSLSGQPFLESPFAEWCVWVSTPTDIAQSQTGYGYLYKVAPYEIMLRNILGFNGDYIELFAAPFRWLKTTKTEDIERQAQAAMLAQMGSTGWGIGDLNDELEFINANGSGSGWQGYENFEKRCEAKISKLILGHADALDSTVGKLGNDNGDSPAQKALQNIQICDGKFVESILNNELFPKLAAIGLEDFAGLTLEYTNDDELAEQREREDKANLETANILLVLKNAGFQVSPEYVSERMGIDLKFLEQSVVPTEDSKNVSNEVMNKLNELYGHKH